MSVFSPDPHAYFRKSLWVIGWLCGSTFLSVSAAHCTLAVAVLCVHMETQGTLALKHDSECNSSRVRC